ncbi:MAG: hypothetical protein IJ759_07840 [Bacteroidales bacterium]|nr:hypothetical protein [Bacteroidales bacterium]MBR1775415.1 hypothetical protein [Bacteroidales bacterium]
MGNKNLDLLMTFWETLNPKYLQIEAEKMQEIMQQKYEDMFPSDNSMTEYERIRQLIKAC